MMLQLSDPAKLKTKKVVFEESYIASDSGTLEQLKELSSRRRVIEESINETSFITKTIAREMAGGLTSRYEQELQKLELYLPLLENLIFHVKGNVQMVRWTADLKIRWSSALSCTPLLKLTGSKFFCIDDLQFELGMTLSLYGAILRERASEVLLIDQVQATTLYRKAAGVYDYLAHEVLPLLQNSASQERPPETTSFVASIMSLICLAEAQAVTSRKAEEKDNSKGLLSKLHYGIKEILDEAVGILQSKTREGKVISQRFEEFIYSCGALHEFRSEKHLAEGLKDAGRMGSAVGVLRHATEKLNKAKKKTSCEESWKLVFMDESENAGEMLRKFEHENHFVWNEKIPLPDELPTLEGKKIVSAIPYQPQRWERELHFRL